MRWTLTWTVDTRTEPCCDPTSPAFCVLPSTSTASAVDHLGAMEMTMRRSWALVPSFVLLCLRRATAWVWRRAVGTRCALPNVLCARGHQ